MTFPVQDVPALIDALMRSDATRPRLTWYGVEGERIELSARVLGNWVAKTANLLVEEFDAGPGTRIRLDMPQAHWKTLVLGLAVSATGGTLTAEYADVTLSSQPGADVVVALPALARSYGADTGSALDYAAIITGYDDVFLPSSPDRTLIADARAAGLPAPRARLLLPDDAPAPLTTLLSVLLADGSLVIAPPAADLARIAQQEAADLG